MSATSSGSSPLPAMSKRMAFAWLLRFAVSMAVLAIIFEIVPIGQVWREARRLAAPVWFAALALFLLGHAAAAAKWRLLIGSGVSFPRAFQAHLAGLGANLCLPGLAGGDVVRAGLVYGIADDKARLAVGSVADRLLDIVGLLVIAGVGAYVARSGAPAGYGVLSWLLLASLVVLAALVPASLALDRALTASAPRGRVHRVATRAIAVTAALVRQPHRLLLCLAISMAVQATFVGINIGLAKAVGLEAPTAAWFFAWSTAKIIAIAPISLGGLGVREAAMARLMAPFGADPAQVIAIGLIWQTILYVSGLVGIAAQLVWKPGGAEAANPPRASGVEPSP